MRIFILLILIVLGNQGLFSQDNQIEISYTAINDTLYAQLDNVKIINLTAGGDTTLYYPDTVLVLGNPVGTYEPIGIIQDFKIFSQYPNQVKDYSNFTVYTPEKGSLEIIVLDYYGKIVVNRFFQLTSGYHHFEFSSRKRNIYIINAKWQSFSQSIKIVGKGLQFNYEIKFLHTKPSEKAFEKKYTIQNFYFNPGDKLLYIGYIDNIESGKKDAPNSSKTIAFQFASNIPCPESPTVLLNGQVLNTVQVFNQCWLKENLNLGIKLDGNQNQTNNSVIEKYCINNEEDSCIKYGGLYQWDEMMAYVELEGYKGICPTGWHIPTDWDWRILEGSADSQFGIEDSVWISNLMFHGYDIALHLKDTCGWDENGNGLDTYGFSVMPGGRRFTNGTFSDTGTYGTFWSSSKVWPPGYAYRRHFASYSYGINRLNEDWDLGFSVRCLRNN